jgi:hypothetical protein
LGITKGFDGVDGEKLIIQTILDYIFLGMKLKNAD